jgi:hypothetical protein
MFNRNARVRTGSTSSRVDGVDVHERLPK